MLRSSLGDYSDAYVVVKGRTTVKRGKKLILKNNTLCRLCISTINNTFIGNAEDFDIVIPIYNLLEHSDNYSVTSGSW